MKQQIRSSGRGLVRRVAPTVMDSVEDVPRLRAEVERLSQQGRRLRSRVADLEEEVQESRRLNRRIAELTDVVQELLLPISQRDDGAVAEVLARYREGL
jgi:predicted RNase H-like nuclease (RuvC/YqgF family)